MGLFVALDGLLWTLFHTFVAQSLHAGWWWAGFVGAHTLLALGCGFYAGRWAPANADLPMPGGQKLVSPDSGGNIPALGESMRADQRAVECEYAALAAERADNGLVILDHEGAIVWVSPGFTRLLGLDNDAVRGRRRDEVAVGPNSDGLTLSRLRRSVSEGKPFRGEVLCYPKGAAAVWVQIDLQPVLDAQGNVVRFVGVESDVSARKRIEVSLRNQQELLAAVVESVPAFVFWKDLNSVYAGCNQSFAQACGFKDTSEVVGLTDFDLRASRKEADSYRQLDAQVIETGRAQVNLEATHKKPGGGFLYTLMNEVALRDYEGEVTGVLGVCMDITAMKLAQQALRVAEERWYHAFEGSGEGVWDWNLASGELFCSPRLLQLLGMGESDAADLVRGWMRRLHPSDAGQARKQLVQHLRGETPVYCNEHRVRGDDGEYRWMLGRGKVVSRDGQGKALRVVGTYADIHEQKNLQMELARTRNLEAIGQLASGIAHEINTPIQYVNDNVHFLKDSFSALKDTLERVVAHAHTHADLVQPVNRLLQEADASFLCEEAPRAIEQSIEGLLQVTRIVGALKDFSHSGSGEKEPAQLNPIVETALVVGRNHWKQVADVHLQLAEALPDVELIRTEIGQVVLNLVVNAADAIAEQQLARGTGRGNIWVSTRLCGGAVELRVTDDGTGMSSEVQARMFDPFYTTKPVGKGSGQGLAICQAIIVKRHQGEIRCESVPGRGTSFIIHLPLRGELARDPP